MGWISVRVDEQLNHQGHADQGQCGEPRGQSQQDQQWEKVLGEGGQVRGHFRRQQWHLVFAAKQRQRRSRQARLSQLEGAVDQVNGKTLDLGLPGFPEHGGDGKTREEGDQAVRDLFKKLDGPFDQALCAGVHGDTFESRCK